MAFASLKVTVISGSVKAKGKSGADTADTFLNVVDAGSRPVTLNISLAASSSSGVTVVAVKPRKVKPGPPTRVRVTFGGLKHLGKVAKGVLVVNTGGTSIDREVSITPGPQPAAPWAELILIGAGGAAVGLFVLIVLVLKRKGLASRLRNRAPGPKWKFDSWATTLTTVGAVLATVLTGATFPSVPSQIDKDTLVQLNLLFGALVVVAPFVFQAIRNPKAPPADQEAGRFGFNVTLLLACCITFGATLGELSALSLLAWELIGGGGWASAAVVGIGLIALLALWYFVLTAYQLASTEWPVPAPPTIFGIERETERAVEVQVVAPQTPSWPLP
jgi:hypothetical protein